MTTNDSQGGSAWPVIITVIALALVIGGVTYFSGKEKAIVPNKFNEDEAMMEI